MVVDLDIKPQDIDRIIEMAWEDRTPFEAIEFQFGLKENGVFEKLWEHILKEALLNFGEKELKEEKQSIALLLVQQDLNLQIKNKWNILNHLYHL